MYSTDHEGRTFGFYSESQKNVSLVSLYIIELLSRCFQEVLSVTRRKMYHNKQELRVTDEDETINYK